VTLSTRLLIALHVEVPRRSTLIGGHKLARKPARLRLGEVRLRRAKPCACIRAGLTIPRRCLLAARREIRKHALVDAEEPLQRSGCDLVAHGESLPLDESEKEKVAAGAAAIRWSR
jgi:hypothetical protein